MIEINWSSRPILICLTNIANASVDLSFSKKGNFLPGFFSPFCPGTWRLERSISFYDPKITRKHWVMSGQTRFLPSSCRGTTFIIPVSEFNFPQLENTILQYRRRTWKSTFHAVAVECWR